MYSSTPITKTILTSIFILALGFTSIWVLSPFLPALLWSAMITISTWPLLMKLERSLGGRRGLAVTIMITAMALIVILPVGMSVYVLFANVGDAIEWLRDLPNKKIPPLPDFITAMPMMGPKLSARWQEITTITPDSLTGYLRSYSLTAMNWLASAAAGTGIFFLHLLLTLGLTGLFYVQGEQAAKGIRMFFIRLAGERGDKSVILAAQSVKAVAMGIIVTAVVQTVLAGAGLYLAGIPAAGILTAVTFVFCIAQLGAVLPLLGAAGWLFFKDQNLIGSLMLAWAVVVGTLDNFLRPVLIHRGADLPLILILAGVIGGIFAFGVVGLFIGPTMLAVTYRLLQSWVEERKIVVEDIEDIKPLPTPIRPQDSTLNH